MSILIIAILYNYASGWITIVSPCDRRLSWLRIQQKKKEMAKALIA